MIQKPMQMSPASRESTTSFNTKSLTSKLIPGPLQKIGASMQEPPYNSHQDGQPPQDAQIANDVNKEPLGERSSDSTQRERFSTAATGSHRDETGKNSFNHKERSDQGQHEQEIRDKTHSKTTRHLEAKLEKEVDYCRRLKAELAQMEAELTTVEDRMQGKEDKIHELTMANHRQHDEIKQLNAELHHVKTKYQQIDQLLQERSEELSTAQRFLGKADRISPSEVASLVQMLNAEIAQQSNFLIDSLTYQRWAGTANDLEHLLKWFHDLLGPWLCDNLGRRLKDPAIEFDPLLMQLAIQMGLIHACTTIINCWDPLFDEVYGDMRRKVGQVVAGRWRALSSAHRGVDRKRAKQYVRDVARNLIAVIGGPASSVDSLPPDLGGKMDDITRKALEIRGHVKSGLTSMDFEAYCISCGTQFDASKMNLEDSDGPGGNKEKTENDDQKNKVICTLEMGLLYKKVISSGKDGEFKEEVGVILKPKVVLADTFAEYRDM